MHSSFIDCCRLIFEYQNIWEVQRVHSKFYGPSVYLSTKELRGSLDHKIWYIMDFHYILMYTNAYEISNYIEMKSTNYFIQCYRKYFKQTCRMNLRPRNLKNFLAISLNGRDQLWSVYALWEHHVRYPFMEETSFVYVYALWYSGCNSPSSNRYYNGENKHIRLRLYIVRQLLENGVISLDFVKSEMTWWILWQNHYAEI